MVLSGEPPQLGTVKRIDGSTGVVILKGKNDNPYLPMEFSGSEVTTALNRLTHILFHKSFACDSFTGYGSPETPDRFSRVVLGKTETHKKLVIGQALMGIYQKREVSATVAEIQCSPTNPKMKPTLSNLSVLLYVNSNLVSVAFSVLR